MEAMGSCYYLHFLRHHQAGRAAKDEAKARPSPAKAPLDVLPSRKIEKQEKGCDAEIPKSAKLTPGSLRSGGAIALLVSEGSFCERSSVANAAEKSRYPGVLLARDVCDFGSP